ncbi:MAG: hypothetical protein VKJ44_04055 [Synechococcus sp.]|nr:hypothetical protein [Synechococcus sp.]
MVPASSPRAVPAGSDPAPGTGWKRWFLLGACFGLGYGVPQRLLNLDLNLRLTSPERFSVQPFPGTELNSLRRRSGALSLPIRADLDRIELEQQQQREAAAIDQRRAEIEARDREPAAPTEGGPQPLPPPTAPSAAPAAAPTPGGATDPPEPAATTAGPEGRPAAPADATP